MLPSVPKSLGRLSDVFISALGAITGVENRLGLPRVKSACVVMVDGLGSSNLQYRAGHAPTLFAQLKTDGSIPCGFPATTVTSLSSFSTGQRAGRHGMVGYQIYDSNKGQTLNLLSGISSKEQALELQPLRTVSEMAIANEVECFFVGPGEYEGSGFTMATMPAAKYVAAKSIEERFSAASKLINSSKNALVYLYVPELDQKAHAHGFKSGQWVEKLEDLESAVKKFVSAIPKSVGVLLTADHGIVDVAQDRQIYLDQLDLPNLVSVGGDPRVLYLYFNTEVIATEKAAVQEFVGKRAYVAEAQELIEADWFGDVEPYARIRMPELFVIALGETALYHRTFAKAKSLQMVGQHGSISPDELNVPLLRFAGFAKK